MNCPPLRYIERESPTNHVNEVTKNIGEEVRLQSLVETFTGQASRWWGTHQSHLQTWMTTSTFFVERFRGNKLTAKAQITKFTEGNNPQKHIQECENEWKRLG